MAAEAVVIDTTPVELGAAVAIEAAEAHAWADMYAAAPADWAASVGLATCEMGGALVLSWAATGRRYFSRAIGLGVDKPASEAGIDEILDLYERAGIRMFLLQALPHCRPAGYERRLRERGLQPFDVQDRVVRDGRLFVDAGSGAEGRGLVVEDVDSESEDEWADFLQRVYRLETGPWLQALVGRPGWHQYVARERGEIVGARGMYIGPDGTAWLGMDGPVPGITTQDYEPDAALCAFIVEDGLARGATGFVTEIEATSAAMDTPGYEYFARLGFRRPYARTHYARR
jgi:hypothetical protein